MIEELKQYLGLQFALIRTLYLKQNFLIKIYLHYLKRILVCLFFKFQIECLTDLFNKQRIKNQMLTRLCSDRLNKITSLNKLVTQMQKSCNSQDRVYFKKL